MITSQSSPSCQIVVSEYFPPNGLAYLMIIFLSTILSLCALSLPTLLCTTHLISVPSTKLICPRLSWKLATHESFQYNQTLCVFTNIWQRRSHPSPWYVVHTFFCIINGTKTSVNSNHKSSSPWHLSTVWYAPLTIFHCVVSLQFTGLY